MKLTLDRVAWRQLLSVVSWEGRFCGKNILLLTLFGIAVTIIVKYRQPLADFIVALKSAIDNYP